MTGLVEIEGIAEEYSEKLAAAGLKTVEALLESGATVAGRKATVEETGISEHLILKW